MRRNHPAKRGQRVAPTRILACGLTIALGWGLAANTLGQGATANPLSDTLSDTRYVVSIHSGDRWIGLAPTELINPPPSPSEGRSNLNEDSYSVSYALLDRTKNSVGAKWLRHAELTENETATALRFLGVQRILQDQETNDDLSKSQLKTEGMKIDELWDEKPGRVTGTAQVKIWRGAEVWETILGTSQNARNGWPENVQAFMRILTLPLEEGRAKEKPRKAGEEIGLGYTQNADIPMPWHPKLNEDPANPIIWSHWAESLGWSFTEVTPGEIKKLQRSRPTLATMLQYPGFIVNLDLEDLRTMTKLGWAGEEWNQEKRGAGEIWSWENREEAPVQEQPKREKADIWWGAISYRGTNYGIHAWEIKPPRRGPAENQATKTQPPQ